MKFAALGLGVFLSVAVIEVVGHTYALLNPSYDVLFLEPDRATGWKQVPRLRWTWAGSYWYANDFSVEIQTNSHGFRDLERSVAKPDETTRVALLGDSLVEAAQVPFEKTAGAVLERGLIDEFAGGRRDQHAFEVLNFGISSFSVGQFLLTWETYARQFDPDFVFVIIAPVHMLRTTQPFVRGEFTSTKGKRLRARPIFRHREGHLIRVPAIDFDEFVAAQKRLVQIEFGGSRMRRKEQDHLAHSMLGELLERVPYLGMEPRADPRPPGGPPSHGAAGQKLLALNMEILAELGRGVEESEARLILVDATLYLDAERVRYLSQQGRKRGTQTQSASPSLSAAAVSETLRAFCREHGLGYISLSDDLMRANEAGIQTRWRRDIHFNEAGNQIFGEAMLRWMKREFDRNRGA